MIEKAPLVEGGRVLKFEFFQLWAVKIVFNETVLTTYFFTYLQNFSPFSCNFDSYFKAIPLIDKSIRTIKPYTNKLFLLNKKSKNVYF